MDRRFSLLRVAACYMVVLLHVSGEPFGNWNAMWSAGNFYDSLSRSCVPLFIMLAGASLLPKQEPISTFFRKRFSRIVPPLLFWSVFYLWWLQHNGVKTGNWAAAIIAGPTMYHLWYFYALVGLYAVVPVLRKFYQNSSRGEQAWFIIVWFTVASLLPTAHNILLNPHCEGYVSFDRLPAVYHLSYFGGYVGYLMLGAFIADSPQKKAGTGWIIFLASSAATMAATYLLSARYGKPCEFFFVYLSPFVVAAAYGLFSAFMAMRPGKPSVLLSELADCSLGIYGLHVFMIDPLFRMAGITASSGNPWIYVPLTATGVFACSFIVIYVARLVKPLRVAI